jgi:hypothetical protein
MRIDALRVGLFHRTTPHRLPMSEPIDINDATTLKHLHCWIDSTDPTHVATVRMNDMAGTRTLVRQRLQIPLGRRSQSVLSSAAIADLHITDAT